jgi:hypothetical protein
MKQKQTVIETKKENVSKDTFHRFLKFILLFLGIKNIHNTADNRNKQDSA